MQRDAASENGSEAGLSSLNTPKAEQLGIRYPIRCIDFQDDAGAVLGCAISPPRRSHPRTVAPELSQRRMASCSKSFLDLKANLREHTERLRKLTARKLAA